MTIKFGDWTCVTDELPINRDYYLVAHGSVNKGLLTKPDKFMVAKFLPESQFWQVESWGLGNDSFSASVTHWMPLPLLPEEAKND